MKSGSRGPQVGLARRFDVWFAFDDALVVKGVSHYYPVASLPPAAFPRNEAVEDVRFSGCVCWCGWGRTLEIGLETWASRFRNIVFEDCDLIHNGGGALSVHLGGPARVEDAVYRNIRIEYNPRECCPQLQKGRDDIFVPKPGWIGQALTVLNRKMFAPDSMYARQNPGCRDEPHGSFSRVSLENIDIAIEPGQREPGSDIRFEPGTELGEIRVDGVRVNGRPYDILADNLGVAQ